MEKAKCAPHVDRIDGRWHAWCECGWNIRGTTNWTTRATQREAMLHAIWHMRKPVRDEMKRRANERRNGGSTTVSHPPGRMAPRH